MTSGRSKGWRGRTTGDEAFLPHVSRDGRRLIYARAVEDMNIWLAAPGQPPSRLIASTRTDNGPQFSPDGKRTAFASNRSGSDEIWISDADGSNATQATTFGGPAVGPPRQLSTERSDEVRPSWSRDGRAIYFASNRTGAWQIWKLPAEGGAAVQVTKGGGREAFESYDGQYVYFVRLAAEGVWRVPVEGGEETRVTERGSLSQWGVAKPGIGILNPGIPAIEFFDLAAGRWRRVLELPKDLRAVTWGPPAFAVSHDGRSFLWVQVDRVEGDLMLVENFR